MLKALVESYEVTPVGADSCRLRWQMTVAMRGPLRRIEPFVGKSLGDAQVKLLREFEKVAATMPRTDSAHASA
jgi:hypothetical protein